MKKFTEIDEVPFNDGYSVQSKGNDDGLFILGMFLYCEITSELSYNFVTAWLKNTIDSTGISGDSFDLEEIDGQIIIVEQHPLEEEKILKFLTTKEELFQFIHEWLRMIYRKPRPLKVMIEQDEKGKITFTWLGNPEEQNLDDFLESQKKTKSKI